MEPPTRLGHWVHLTRLGCWVHLARVSFQARPTCLGRWACLGH